jgi:hypothetical protein
MTGRRVRRNWLTAGLSGCHDRHTLFGGSPKNNRCLDLQPPLFARKESWQPWIQRVQPHPSCPGGSRALSRSASSSFTSPWPCPTSLLRQPWVIPTVGPPRRATVSGYRGTSRQQPRTSIVRVPPLPSLPKDSRRPGVSHPLSRAKQTFHPTPAGRRLRPNYSHAGSPSGSPWRSGDEGRHV